MEKINNQQNELITVDVTKNYPEKELTLQDFMDVEYIPLETNDEFVTQGKVMAIGAEVILITNWANDGNLFVFDRKTGKALKKINRKGQGGEEYIGITEIVLDEANKEIFVIAYTGSKISVYDLDGNFKRSFKAAGTESHVNTFNYDRENLISYVPDNSLENPSNANTSILFNLFQTRMEVSPGKYQFLLMKLKARSQETGKTGRTGPLQFQPPCIK